MPNQTAQLMVLKILLWSHDYDQHTANLNTHHVNNFLHFHWLINMQHELFMFNQVLKESCTDQNHIVIKVRPEVDLKSPLILSGL